MQMSSSGEQGCMQLVSERSILTSHVSNLREKLGSKIDDRPQGKVGWIEHAQQYAVGSLSCESHPVSAA